MTRVFQQCTKCVLDTSDDPSVTFDADGVCDYCHTYDRRRRLFVDQGEDGRRALERLAENIKTSGRGRSHDCVAGISGGIDSTYTVYLAKQLGLRPLVVHFDNGWNTELAVKNIEQICNKLGFELFTYVVNWEEFRDLQLSYLRASVVDIEVPTDQGIFATLQHTAKKTDTRFILSGNNITTEGTMPKDWVWHKWDLLNLEAIHREFGSRPLKTYPMLGFWNRIYYERFLHIQTVELLNFVPYVKEEAKAVLTNELGWRDYAGKHYESVFTRFYQGYILPKKFGIDKRKAHLSCLILSGQTTRDAALDELRSNPYTEDMQADDLEFVLKKLGLRKDEFDQIMATPPRAHLSYPSYITSHYKYHERFFQFIKPLRTLKHKLSGTSAPVNY